VTSTIIPFYGSDNRAAFAIERAAMDRPGLVLDELDRVLPKKGLVIDVGAGDGFSSRRLQTPRRSVIAVEPSAGMIDQSANPTWVQAVAQDMPFRSNSFDGLYATWAYFFPDHHDISSGLAEAHRVVKPGSPIVVVDNAGADEFSAVAGSDLGTNLGFWEDAGFEIQIIDTVFSFDSIEDATELLRLYFGNGVKPRLEIGYRVAVMAMQAGP